MYYNNKKDSIAIVPESNRILHHNYINIAVHNFDDNVGVPPIRVDSYLELFAMWVAHATP